MTQQVICPVMGSPVKDIKTAAHSEYKGKTYYFCCPSCKDVFDADPAKYANGNGSGMHHCHHHH